MPSTVLTAWTGTLLRALEARDIDASALASGVGITSEMLADPDRRIPLPLSTQLWHAAVEVTGDDAIGIEVSRHVRPGSFHALGHAFVSSPTLRAALERAARFSRVTSDVAVASTHLVGSELVFGIGWRSGTERPAIESVDAVLATIVRSARFLLGRDVSPTRVELERPPPSAIERFESFYRCPIRFEAPTSALAFDRSIVELPVPGANQRLASLNDDTTTAYLASLEPSTIADQVREVLIDALAGEPDIAAVAAELQMSPRTLQRHLSNDGTSFRSVLADARRDVADALLASGTLSVTEIALRLGFSESAAFSRAYRRWTGESPAARRRRASP